MTKSYDATTHFETTCDNIIEVYKKVTGKDFDFSACKVDSCNFRCYLQHDLSVPSKTRLRVEPCTVQITAMLTNQKIQSWRNHHTHTHISITLQIIITEYCDDTTHTPQREQKNKCIFTSLLFNLHPPFPPPTPLPNSLFTPPISPHTHTSCSSFSSLFSPHSYLYSRKYARLCNYSLEF